jgi:hypothetical protein
MVSQATSFTGLPVGGATAAGVGGPNTSGATAAVSGAPATPLYDRCSAIIEAENKWTAENGVAWFQLVKANWVTANQVRTSFLKQIKYDLEASFGSNQANNLSAWGLTQQLPQFKEVAQFSGLPGECSLSTAAGRPVSLAVTADLIAFFPKSPGFEGRALSNLISAQEEDSARFSWLMTKAQASISLEASIIPKLAKTAGKTNKGGSADVHLCPFCPTGIKGDKALLGHVLRCHLKVRPCCRLCLNHYRQRRGLANHICALEAGVPGKKPCTVRPASHFNDQGCLIVPVEGGSGSA